MSEKNEALRLADALMEEHPFPRDIRLAADELRRLHELLKEWEAKAATWLASPEAAQRLEGYRELAQRLEKAEAQRDALLEALLRIESAVDWYLGRSSFTQTTQLKGLKHSVNVRKELFAAHDEVRAAIKAVKEQK